MENRQEVLVFVFRNAVGNVDDLLKSIRVSAYMMFEEGGLDPYAHFITEDFWYLVPLRKYDEEDIWEHLVTVYEKVVSEAVCVYWMVESEEGQTVLEEYIFSGGSWKKYTKIHGEKCKPAKLDIPEDITRAFTRIYDEHLSYIQ